MGKVGETGQVGDLMMNAKIKKQIKLAIQVKEVRKYSYSRTAYIDNAVFLQFFYAVLVCYTSRYFILFHFYSILCYIILHNSIDYYFILHYASLSYNIL